MAATPAAVLASGGDATTAGFYTSTGTEPASDLDAWVNYCLDIIAQRTSTVTPVAKGGTGATTPAAARAALGAVEALGGAIRIRWEGSSLNFVPAINGVDTSPLLRHDQAASTYATAGSVSGMQSQIDGVRGGQHSSDVYNRVLGGSYRSLYTDTSGLIGWVSSTRRHKKNIRPADVDPAAVLAMELVTFLYKVEVDTDREGITQWGLIAEDLDELGLHWLVDYGDGDRPEGVRYDRLALALLPALQHVAARAEAAHDRLTAIETHLDALGGDLDAPTH